MATKIKIITAKDFLEVTPEGIINLATSRQLIVDVARGFEYEPFRGRVQIKPGQRELTLTLKELCDLLI